MIRLSRYFFIKFIYIAIDILFLVLTIYFICLFRQSTLPFEVTFKNVFLESSSEYHYVFLFWILTTIILNSSFSLYETKREMFETFEIWRVIQSVALASLLTIVAVFLAKIQDFPRSIVVIGFFAFSFLLSLWRILKRVYVEYLVAQGYNNFNAVIIGAGRVGKTLAEEIAKRKGLGIQVVGYLDDFKENSPSADGPRILGKISDFKNVANREFINKVFITIHHDSKVFLHILEEAKELGIAVRVIPEGFELIQDECQRYNVGFIPILGYWDAARPKHHFGKRLFDFLSALFLCILLMPFLIILAIVIKLDSPGPIFYFSKRYGQRGRIFNMLKFRSMVQDADKAQEKYKAMNEVDGPIFKIKNDPRITSVGRFLRKYSIDELPQLFNVLFGDMSLVGPRPFPVDQVQKEDLRQLTRLRVRPGITGLWQIKGRSDVSFAQLLKLDLWYINNWSFWLDVSILLQTLPVVIKGKGAY